jgi:hypothetical protein
MDRKTKLNRDKSARDDDEAFTAQLLRDKAARGEALRTKLFRDNSTKDDASRTRLVRDKSAKDDASRTKLVQDKSAIADDEEFTRQLLRDKAAKSDVFKTKLVRDKLPTNQNQSRLTNPASSFREEVHHSPLEFQKASTPGTQMPNHDTNMASRQTRMESLRPQERREQENWLQSGVQQASSARSHIPTETTFKSEYDKKMASRQTRIESLAPQEREEQEAWAQTQLNQISTSCPQGFPWARIPGGYRCQPNRFMQGNHKVTDELLAEGKGGVYYRLIPFGFPQQLLQQHEEIWDGPFYEDPNITLMKQALFGPFSGFGSGQGFPGGRGGGGMGGMGGSGNFY